MKDKKSILSCAELIAEVLGEDEGVREKVKTFYPVIAPESVKCPYVVYRISGLSTRQVKIGSADTAEIEIMCCGSNFKQMVETSEAVRSALDGTQITSDDGILELRSCFLSGCSEGYDSGTFVRTLLFTVRIN